MAQYNLTDNVADSFTFKIGDFEYSFRYPTTNEMRELSLMNSKLKELVDSKATDSEVEAQSKLSEAKMNELVTPVGHDVSISAILEDQPVNVVRNFRSMMSKEINLG